MAYDYYPVVCGRDERIRTSDPHTPSVVRYQAALHPDKCQSMKKDYRVDT